MKKAAIIALVCVNVALLGALVVRTLPQAEAQPVHVSAPPAPSYLLVTGHVALDQDVVYVLDVNSRKLAAWEFNQTTKRLERVRLMRNLTADFRK